MGEFSYAKVSKNAILSEARQLSRLRAGLLI